LNTIKHNRKSKVKIKSKELKRKVTRQKEEQP